MLTIAIISIFTAILYYMAGGSAVKNLISSLTIVGLFCVFDPSLRSLPASVYVLPAAVLWIGLQVFLPMVQGRLFIHYRRSDMAVELCIGRFSLALVG